MKQLLVAVAMVAVTACGTAPSGTTRSPDTTSSVPPGSTSTLATTSTGEPTTTPETTRPPDLVIGPTGGEGAAADLHSTPECDPDVIAQAVADLTWTPAADSGEAQMIEVTIYDFELPGGWFSELLGRDTGSYRFAELSGQAVHHWRVLTLRDGVWTPSEPDSFVGPTCVADVQP